jgi:hypothetical protein
LRPLDIAPVAGGSGGIASEHPLAAVTDSDVLGWASSPEPAEPSPFMPELSWALTRACNGLGPGFRFKKPEPRAQAQALIPQVTWRADS